MKRHVKIALLGLLAIGSPIYAAARMGILDLPGHSGSSGHPQLELPAGPGRPEEYIFVDLPGGPFKMGAPTTEVSEHGSYYDGIVKSASPEHVAFVPPFSIGAYEVSASEFCAFLNDPRYRTAPKDNPYAFIARSGTIVWNDRAYSPRTGYEWAPANHVSFEGARTYCQWYSETYAVGVRLPTELEWEFAARGKEGRTYPWGEASPVGRAFYAAHYQWAIPWLAPPVVTSGLFENGRTPEGVYDLIGNTNEWCGNTYFTYSDSGRIDGESDFEALLKREVVAPVTRGGQYIDGEHSATGWTRHKGGNPKANFLSFTGFRLVKEM